METEILTKVGLSELQAKIYLFLVREGQSTPTEIAQGVSENRTTVYSALEKLEKLNLITKQDRGKINAYTPNHPSSLEVLSEKRLRAVARQTRALEAALPNLINYYKEYQHELGAVTFYGKEGLEMIRNKIITTGAPIYFVRSPADEKADPEGLEAYKKARAKAGIQADNITPSEFTDYTDAEVKKWNLTRTFLPSGDYNSSVEIDIFGDNVAFINYSDSGTSTLSIESPEIADAMRQFFLFSKKYIQKATTQDELEPKETSRKNELESKETDGQDEADGY